MKPSRSKFVEWYVNMKRPVTISTTIKIWESLCVGRREEGGKMAKDNNHYMVSLINLAIEKLISISRKAITLLLIVILYSCFTQHSSWENVTTTTAQYSQHYIEQHHRTS